MILALEQTSQNKSNIGPRSREFIEQALARIEKAFSCEDRIPGVPDSYGHAVIYHTLRGKCRIWTLVDTRDRLYFKSL